jgi:hypothetical protein
VFKGRGHDQEEEKNPIKRRRRRRIRLGGEGEPEQERRAGQKPVLAEKEKGSQGAPFKTEKDGVGSRAVMQKKGVKEKTGWVAGP